jgi:hypothetical protein
LCDSIVLDLVSQVRNVVLMNVYLELENPGGSGFWSGGVYEPCEGNGEVSLRATWVRGGRILSQQGGFQVSRRGLERGAKGSKGELARGEKAREFHHVIAIHVHVHKRMPVVIE